jgi:hypothetical protein
VRNTNRMWNVAMLLSQIASLLCLRELMRPRPRISFASRLTRAKHN